MTDYYPPDLSVQSLPEKKWKKRNKNRVRIWSFNMNQIIKPNEQKKGWLGPVKFIGDYFLIYVQLYSTTIRGTIRGVDCSHNKMKD